jgi:hypothetical protein
MILSSLYFTLLLLYSYSRRISSPYSYFKNLEEYPPLLLNSSFLFSKKEDRKEEIEKGADLILISYSINKIVKIDKEDMLDK